MKKIFSIFAILLTGFALFADEPLPDMKTYTVKSSGGKFYLKCDSEKNATTCFEITEKGDREKWIIHDWANFALVSDSGIFCILDDTQGLVNEDFDENTVLFTVYKNGKLFDTLTVGKVYKKLIYVTLHATVSHYPWGHIQEIYDDGILLSTNEGAGQFWYDFGKKKVVSAQKKLAELSSKKQKKAFSEFELTFADFQNYIKDNSDREKLSAAVAKIQSLYKNKKQVESPIYYYDVFEDGDINLRLRYSDGGAFKGAFGHSVKAVFYFKDEKSCIHFFLCNDDDCELFIDIAGGGKRENVQGWGSVDSDFQPDYEPARFYEFNSKTKEIRTGDFYWE